MYSFIHTMEYFIAITLLGKSLYPDLINKQSASWQAECEHSLFN